MFFCSLYPASLSCFATYLGETFFSISWKILIASWTFLEGCGFLKVSKLFLKWVALLFVWPILCGTSNVSFTAFVKTSCRCPVQTRRNLEPSSFNLKKLRRSFLSFALSPLCLLTWSYMWPWQTITLQTMHCSRSVSEHVEKEKTFYTKQVLVWMNIFW